MENLKREREKDLLLLLSCYVLPLLKIFIAKGTKLERECALENLINLIKLNLLWKVRMKLQENSLNFFKANLRTIY